jgi:hypothetical protein
MRSPQKGSHVGLALEYLKRIGFEKMVGGVVAGEAVSSGRWPELGSGPHECSVLARKCNCTSTERGANILTVTPVFTKPQPEK